MKNRGFFAKVLVDIDILSSLPNQFLVVLNQVCSSFEESKPFEG